MLRTRTTGTTPAGNQVNFVSGSAWSSDDAVRRIDLVLVFALAASLLDVATTWYALDSARHSEQNPVMRALMDHLGLVPVLALNLALRVGIAVILAFLARRAARPAVRYTATATLVVVTVWWCVIVFANSVVIGRAL